MEDSAGRLMYQVVLWAPLPGLVLAAYDLWLQDRLLFAALIIALCAILSVALFRRLVRREAQLAAMKEELALTRRDLRHNDLLVQEMKHRIKNHITRIQSIARQSARGAGDVAAFMAAFEARLRAMASVQEVLAGTASPQAGLRDILANELRQVLDPGIVDGLLVGPDVRLDERRAHAFGLVVHELVTNAMKYGGLSARGEGLNVGWHLRPADRKLAVDWDESFVTESARHEGGAGFGSRLIEASVTGDLGGTLKRTFHPGGLRVRLDFPVPD